MLLSEQDENPARGRAQGETAGEATQGKAKKEK